MRIPALALTLLFIFTLLTACDDDGSSGTPSVPSAKLSFITAADAIYDVDAQELYSDVSVTVVDQNGNRMPGKYVMLDISETSVTADAAEGVTGDDGVATFRLASSRIIDATVLAYVGSRAGVTADDGIALEEPGVVTFTLSVSATNITGLDYTVEGGTFSLDLAVTDGGGAVDGAELTLDALESLSLDTTGVTTDHNGLAPVGATTAVTGSQQIIVTVAGIEGSFIVSPEFMGPLVGGEAVVSMSYPHFNNPKMGAIAIRVGGSTLEILGQLPAGPVIEGLGESATWHNNLPIIPEASLLQRDGANNMDVGIFLPILFNDVNDNGTHDANEPIIGAKTSGGVLVFIAPDDPQSDFAGWLLLDELTDNPTFLDWDTYSQSLDISIYAAPVIEPGVAGSIAGPAEDNRRVSLMVVDAPAFITAAQSGNPFVILGDPGASEVLMDVPVDADSSYSGMALDPRALLDPVTLNAWKYDMDMGGEVLSQLIVIPFYYIDTDLSGGFNTGDTLRGFARPPVGGEWSVSYILNYPATFALFTPDMLWMHMGFNWWANPLDRTIVAATPQGPDYTFELDSGIPDGWVDVDFTVSAADAPDDATPVAVGTFSSNGTETITTTTCTGCENVTADMVFMVTENYQSTHFMDWSQSFNMGPFN